MNKFLQTKHVLDLAIRRLEARRKLAEAQIELSTIELCEASEELHNLHDTRRKMHVGGGPMFAAPRKLLTDLRAGK